MVLTYMKSIQDQKMSLRYLGHLRCKTEIISFANQEILAYKILFLVKEGLKNNFNLISYSWVLFSIRRW